MTDEELLGMTDEELEFMTDEEMGLEPMTDEEMEQYMTGEERARWEDLKRRKADLAKCRALFNGVKGALDFIGEMQTKHDCRTIKELPKEVRALVRERLAPFLSKEDHAQIEAYQEGRASVERLEATGIAALTGFSRQP